MGNPSEWKGFKEMNGQNIEYDQDMQKSHTEDQPMAPCWQATGH